MNKKRVFDTLADMVVALKDRFSKVLQVIDDALDSENIKDRTWAVDIILKRLGMESALTANPSGKPAKADKRAIAQEVDALSDDELLTRIREQLHPEHHGDTEA